MPIVNPSGSPIVPATLAMVTVSLYSDVRALLAGQASRVEVLGGSTVGDGQDGVFYWNSTSTAADDGFATLAPNAGGTGRWIRIYGAFKQSGTGAATETVSTALRRIVFAEQYGAASSAIAAVNTAAIQAALNEIGNTRGGGTVYIFAAGTYLLASAGSNPYQAAKKYCLDMKYDNVTLFIGPGVILKLANSQQTDAGGNVNLICFQDRTNLTITGGGSIDGNAAGQTGWTGGRLQTDGGLIVGHNASVLGNTNIRVENLTLRNSLSNAVWMRGGTPRSSFIYVNNNRVFACGEGPVIEKSNHVWLNDNYIDDTTDVMAGDGIEPSDCDYVISDRCIFNASGAVFSPGSAYDLFGVRYATISNFVIRNWPGIGIDVNISADGNEPTEIAIGPGSIDRTDYGIVLRGGKLNNIAISNVVMDGHSASIGDGIRVASDGVATTGSVTITGCSARRFTGSGVLIQAMTDVQVCGGQYNNNGAAGVRISVPGSGIVSGDMARIAINGVSATGNAAGGVSVLSNTYSAKPSGTITGCYLPSNTGGPIVVDAPSALQNINVSGVYPTFAPPDQIYTPTLLSGGAAVSRTYAQQIGRYRLLGDNRCWISAKVFLSAKGSSVGATTISLPFTAKTVTNNNSPFTIFPYKVTYTGEIGALVQSAGTSISVYVTSSGGGLDTLADTGLANDTAFFVEGIYEIADNVSLP